MVERRAARLERQVLSVEPLAGGRALLDGRELIDFSSNDYLGFGSRSVSLTAPSGARASRLVTGSSPAHQSVEAHFARFIGTESALLFSSGYAANVGIIPALMGEGDVIFSDERNHGSIIDGCRLSRAKTIVFPHLSADALEVQLRNQRHRFRHAMIATESVFSMDGDHADLFRLQQMAAEHRCVSMVDEAHSVGILGPNGQGLCSLLPSPPDIVVAPMGKALGVMGAFVCCSAAIMKELTHSARSFVFSTGVSPLLVGALECRLGELATAGDARETRTANCTRLSEGLRASGWKVIGGDPIVGVVAEGAARAVALEDQLRGHGMLARAIRPPTVPAETSRLRLVPTAEHSPSDVDALLSALGTAQAFEARQPRNRVRS